ncbi:hypothetical protein [Aquimarina sp. RZ0]|uniref:hypothetical protein n=1 Tax=Aquimarina sp. RZ0 TaxID=2607730 RepID=UPI0011F2CFA7|nr:hypothetical protein [Aquimarina sp. RZ0]KAA1243123.1 hypothetical protein F0000_22445 [Aquimarina sp. RZ0]
MEIGQEVYSGDGFYTFNFLYGRELELTTWLKVEGNAGLGLYHFKTDENDEFDQKYLRSSYEC